MVSRRWQPALPVLAFALATTAAMPAIAQQQGSERNWAAIERCAAIADAHQRHACLDGVLDALGLLTAGAGEAAPAPRPATEPPAAAASAPPAASADHRAPVAPRASDTPEAPARPAWAQPQDRTPDFPGIDSQVASARLMGRRGVEVLAADGTRWRSTESVSLRRAPREGAAFAVEPGALGSYNCRLEASTYFKCEPVW